MRSLAFSISKSSWGPVHGVSNVDFDVHEDEVFGIAGESGCGKSTVIVHCCTFCRITALPVQTCARIWTAI
ncbi:MAG: ATP-binding cassette domain-containing protein [Rhodobacteraceae bacterium]|nr:ATP-binding cassette domain-containing protein [Paracoccaceae bacterium]